MKLWLPWLIVLVLLAVVWRLAAVAMTLENRSYASEAGFCYEPVDYTRTRLHSFGARSVWRRRRRGPALGGICGTR